LQQPAPWGVGLIVAATACRVLLVVDLVACARMERPHPLRFVGAPGGCRAWGADSDLQPAIPKSDSLPGTCVAGLGLYRALFVG